MDSADEETFGSQFSPLDELIQLIYQGAHKFVVLSSVNDSSWTVHLGLTGASGRWWEGRWAEKDFNDFVGHKTSGRLVDTFVEHLTKAFLSGELYVANWNPEKGAEINLTVGTSAKTPVHIPLKELGVQEAIVYATTVITDIAFQARGRQCKLHPPSFPAVSATVSRQPTVPPARPNHGKRKVKEITGSSTPSPQVSPTRKSKTITAGRDSESKAQTKIRELEAELAQAQREIAHRPPAASSAAGAVINELATKQKNATAPLRPAKGASLANPNKKARKYQPIEFEDD